MKGVKFALFSLTVITGACGIAYQYTFSKLASDLLGNTAEEWALTIGVMLLAMGFGADLQKKISTAHLFTGFILLEIALSLLGGFGGIFLSNMFSVKRSHFVLTQYSLIAGIGVLIGMEIPILLRLNAKIIPKLAMNVAQIFRADYLGGFLGAMLWVFVLNLYFANSIEAALAVSLTNLVGAFIAFFLYQRKYAKHAAVADEACDETVKATKASSATKNMRYFFKLGLLAQKNSNWHALVLFLCLCGSTALIIVGFLKVPEQLASLEQKLYADKVIFSESSAYQRIVLSESVNGNLRLYLNGKLQFSAYDEAIYHDFLVHPAMSLARDRESVLILGGGDGLALREVLRYQEVKQVTLVDLDSAVIRLASSHPKLLALNEQSFLDARLSSLVLALALASNEGSKPAINKNEDYRPAINKKIVYDDAYGYMRKTEEHYDVIIVDFPDPSREDLSKLYSLSFYRSLVLRLRPGGIVVQQASSPRYAAKTFALIRRTMQRSGLNTVALKETVPSFGEWGWILAAPQLERSTDELQALLQTLVFVKTPRTLSLASLQRALLPPPRLLGTEQPFLQSETSQAEAENSYNTLLNNLAYKTYRQEVLAIPSR